MADWEAVGLSGFDGQVYRQLLGDPGVPVPQLAEALDAPDDEVEAAVARLVEAGLVRVGSEAAPPRSIRGPGSGCWSGSGGRRSTGWRR
jgi:hypothetical protein